MRFLPAVSLLALCGLSLSTPADAILRLGMINASGACQAARASFDANLRKRPTAIANEGSGPVFVSCSLLHEISESEMLGVGAIVTNDGTSPVTVSCTLVNGARTNSGDDRAYAVESVTVPAGAVRELSWPELGLGLYEQPAVGLSCVLPANVEIGGLYTMYDDGV